MQRTQKTRFGTNYIAHGGFESLDGRPNALRIDLYVSDRDGSKHVEGRHTATNGGPDYSPLHCTEGTASCGCGWGYLGASHTQAAHDESMAMGGY